MSEYQYIYFAAVDRALNDKQLAYMRRQSTRAEVARWQFENEYQYGSFGGKTVEMPRIRDSLIAGDLRPLYLAWLSCVWDRESIEPPVPGGLRKLSDELKELVDFYEISPDLVGAASENAPDLPKQSDQKKLADKWLACGASITVASCS